MVSAIVAAVAALAGVLVQALINDRRARAEQRVREAEQRRQEFVTAVRGVLEAYEFFRRHQYLKIAARRDGRADTEESREKRYEARGAFTNALNGLYLATDDRKLLQAANEARELVVALGEAAPEPGVVDEEAVEEIGQRARESHTALQLAANHALYR